MELGYSENVPILQHLKLLGFFDHLDETPAFGFRKRAGFHDFHHVTRRALIGLVVCDEFFWTF